MTGEPARRGGDTPGWALRVRMRAGGLVLAWERGGGGWRAERAGRTRVAGSPWRAWRRLRVAEREEAAAWSARFGGGSARSWDRTLRRTSADVARYRASRGAL